MENVEQNCPESTLRDDNIQAVVAEIKQDPVYNDLPDDQKIVFLLEKGIEISSKEEYSYEGVLPHPSIMEGYEKYYPGVTKRLIEDSINEGIHRRQLEEKMVSCEIKNTLRGMYFALIVVVLAIAGAVLSAYLGSTVIGSIIGIGGLATLAYTFIQGKKK